MQQTPSTFPSKTKQRSPNIQHATCILESMSIEFIPTQIYTCSYFFVPSYMVCISIVYQIIEDSCECMWGTCFHSFEISSLAVFGYSYMAKGGLQFPQWNLVTHKVSICREKKKKQNASSQSLIGYLWEYKGLLNINQRCPLRSFTQLWKFAAFCWVYY